MDTEKANRENALRHARADAESAREHVQIPGGGHGQTVSRRKLERQQHEDEVARLEAELANTECPVHKRHWSVCALMAEQAEIDLPIVRAKNLEMAAALEWYGEKAAALTGWRNKPEHYPVAILAEMEADGGKRAGAALSGEGKVWEQVRRAIEAARRHGTFEYGWVVARLDEAAAAMRWE